MVKHLLMNACLIHVHCIFFVLQITDRYSSDIDTLQKSNSYITDV